WPPASRFVMKEIPVNTVEPRRTCGIALLSGSLIALVANAALGFLFPDHNDHAAPLHPFYVPLQLAGTLGATLLLLVLAALIVGACAEIVGPLLLGWQLLRHSIGPRWIGLVLLVSAPVT